MALSTFIWHGRWAPCQHCIKKLQKYHTKELILGHITVNKGMCGSRRMPETHPVFAGPGLYWSWAQRLSSEQVGWRLLALLSLSADTFYLPGTWCCRISTEFPVFSNSEALGTCCTGQMYSLEDDHQENGGAVWGKEGAGLLHEDNLHHAVLWQAGANSILPG